jgi:hypothetical protein
MYLKGVVTSTIHLQAGKQVVIFEPQDAGRELEIHSHNHMQATPSRVLLRDAWKDNGTAQPCNTVTMDRKVE